MLPRGDEPERTTAELAAALAMVEERLALLESGQAPDGLVKRSASRRATGDGTAVVETTLTLDALLATAPREAEWQNQKNAHVKDLPLNIAAEVQIIDVRYLEQGRELSHLLYKIFRCESATELARDAGGKRREGRARMEAAERACMAIVERARAERRMG